MLPRTELVSEMSMDEIVKDVTLIKSVLTGGTFSPKAAYLACENVASYAANQLLPADKPILATATGSEPPLSSEAMIDTLDSVLPDPEGRLKAGRIDWANLIKTVIQIIPVILPLLKQSA